MKPSLLTVAPNKPRYHCTILSATRNAELVTDSIIDQMID